MAKDKIVDDTADPAITEAQLQLGQTAIMSHSSDAEKGFSSASHSNGEDGTDMPKDPDAHLSPAEKEEVVGCCALFAARCRRKLTFTSPTSRRTANSSAGSTGFSYRG